MLMKMISMNDEDVDSGDESQLVEVDNDDK